MPWTFDMSPLDKTIDALEWLTGHMAKELATGDEITREDYRALMLSLMNVAADLRPLQDLRVQERREHPSS